MLQTILFLILSITVSYGFVNIEPPTIGSKNGFSGEILFGTKYSSGNSNSYSSSAANKIQFSTKKWLTYFLFSYDYGQSNNDEDTNNGMGHFRYIEHIGNSSYDYELFLQMEFDAFEDVRHRDLIGINIRKKLNVYFDKLYLGSGFFYSYLEPDKVTLQNPIDKRIKFNSYLSFLKKINDNLSITYLGYYQPNVKKISDFRISQTIQFDNKISKNLYLSLEMKHKYNATPYHEIEKSDIRSSINLKYKLD